MRDADRVKFNNQKHAAKQRGIPFRLTFDEWLSWWLETGRYHERGNRRGQYVMGRIGDRGAYELGNIIWLLAQRNCADPHYGAAGNAKLTEEQVLYIRKSQLTARELASMFGVDYSSILLAKNGSTWRNIGGPIAARRRRKKLTEEQVVAIKGSRLTESAIADMYSVSRSSVAGIKQGRTWRHLSVQKAARVQ
jgi:hypothetical protein